MTDYRKNLETTAWIIGIIGVIATVVGVVYSIKSSKESRNINNYYTTVNQSKVKESTHQKEDKQKEPSGFKQHQKEETPASLANEIINAIFLNTSDPADIAFIIKNKTNIDEDLARLTSSYLNEQGITSNASLFKSTIITKFSLFNSNDNTVSKAYKLDKFCNWYLIGEVKKSIKVNDFHRSDKAVTIIFTGSLIGVSTENIGKNYLIEYTEGEPGNEIEALNEAYKNMAHKLAGMIKEKISK